MFSIAFAALVLGGCATVRPAARPLERLPSSDPPVAEPLATPLPTSPESDPALLSGSPAAVEPAAEAAFIALALVGTPYAPRGSSPETGFDCSGLVAYVYARALKLSLPRNTTDLSRTGVSIAAAELRPGDLVFYNTQHRPYSHVGIYLGEMRFVHAPSSGGAVRLENMRVSYWKRRFDGARRITF